MLFGASALLLSPAGALASLPSTLASPISALAPPTSEPAKAGEPKPPKDEPPTWTIVKSPDPGRDGNDSLKAVAGAGATNLFAAGTD